MVFKVAEPFMKVTDTTSLVINGDTKLDIPVTPYWLIRNPQYTVAADSTVTATFKISKIITDANAKTINRVAIFINRTRIVDDGINFATAYKTTISDLNNVTLSAKVSKTYPSGYGVGNQSYFYVRIGLRVTGINNYIFSPVQKIDLPH
jgi:hypothetical protein